VLKPEKPIIPNWFVFTLFAGIGFFGYSIQAVDWFRATPGDLIDGRFNSVILEHLINWLQLGLNGKWTDVWSPTFFYPYPNVLVLSDNHFGTAISYITLRYAGFSREIAYGGWYVLGVSLNFICSYYVLRRLQFGMFASSAAAFVYAFSLPVIAQDGHSQLSYRFAIPFAFLALWELLKFRGPSSLAWLVFWVGFQFFCSIYLGIFLSLFLASCILAFYLTGNKSSANFLANLKSQSELKKLALLTLIILSAFSTALLGVKYQAVSQQYGFVADAYEVKQMIPRLESYLIADRSLLSSFIGQTSSSHLGEMAYRGEHQLFFGIGVFALFAIGSWFCWVKSAGVNNPSRQSQTCVARVAFIALLIIFLSTLMFGAGSAWNLIATLPGLKFIRAVSRIVLVMTFPVSIIVALACENLYSYINAKNYFQQLSLMIITALLLCSETVFFQKSRTPIEQWHERLQALEAELPRPLAPDSVLFIPKDVSKPGYELPEVDAMILSQNLGIPTINGYSGKFPKGHEHNPVERCISASERLEGYANFLGSSASNTMQIESIKNRIVKIPNISCD